MRRERVEKTTNLVQIVAAMLAVAGTLIAAYTGYLSQRMSSISTGVVEQERIKSIENELSAIKHNLVETNEQIKSLSEIPEQTKMTSQLGSISSSVNQIQDKIIRLEQVIIQDPIKALEIPLLRKDLDNQKALNQAEIAAIRQEVERTYNLLIGSVVGIGLAVITSVVTNLFKKEKAKE